MPRPPTTKVTVAVPTDELETFRNRFPSHGSITWFFSEALTRFNRSFDFDPHDFISESVEEIKID